MIRALALALALSGPTAREAAMERCAEAVIAKLHPTMGMADMTGTRFEGLTASAAGKEWVVIGAISEPDGGTRLTHRFTCRTRGEKPPRVALAAAIRR